ncbi:Molecular chaperones (DnaJ family) [Giardia duodenalis assemblage B]|uniref:Molecular chaperones (DnaJ family) n=1 Tax=Giardia duodenalis assemblage B TaxID=1394984 RepID=A0A132NNB2_GIAIN|nr:Molecular chaperones (DnaJ family) [Giardia intestinalis assemblage B]
MHPFICSSPRHPIGAYINHKCEDCSGKAGTCTGPSHVRSAALPTLQDHVPA